MDELLAEEVINGTITQDEALEECDDPEKLLGMIRVRKSMRYELRSAIFNYKAMKATNIGLQFLDKLKSYYTNLTNYKLQGMYYYNRFQEFREKSPSQLTESVINMTQSDINNLKKALNKPRNQIPDLFEKVTKKINEYKETSIQNAYAGIFQGLAEIINYLADNL